MKTGSLLYNEFENKVEQTLEPNEEKKNDIEKENGKFDPTVKLLLRITKTILENDSIGRTTLTLKANVNYTILVKYLEWLSGRELVEFFIEDGKVKVRLTTAGTEFTFLLCGLIGNQEDEN